MFPILFSAPYDMVMLPFSNSFSLEGKVQEPPVPLLAAEFNLLGAIHPINFFSSSVCSRVKYEVVLPSLVFLYPRSMASSFSVSSSSESSSSSDLFLLLPEELARACSLAFRLSSFFLSSSIFFFLCLSFSSSSSFFLRSFSQSSNDMASSPFDKRSTHSSSQSFFHSSNLFFSAISFSFRSLSFLASSSSLSEYNNELDFFENAFASRAFSFAF
mmetsp:Transcript_21354/g.44899  ORF Transcript_21354/g.44899 Transcript_21354/m.44899 type:complete len:215 (+) Transcript_21354:805-1449(+)